MTVTGSGNEAAASPLAGRAVLVVEDEYFLAQDLAATLRNAGALPLGPCGNMKDALAAIDTRAPDAAVLDVNLRREPIFPFARTLRARAIPFVFATGYDQLQIPAEFAEVPRLEKPVEMRLLLHALAQLFAAPAA